MLFYLRRSCQELPSSFCVHRTERGTFVFCSLLSGLCDNLIVTGHATSCGILIILTPVL